LEDEGGIREFEPPMGGEPIEKEARMRLSRPLIKSERADRELGLVEAEEVVVGVVVVLEEVGKVGLIEEVTGDKVEAVEAGC
jgi:hypothetical protein